MNSYLREYVGKIHSGEIVAGERLTIYLDRLIEEIDSGKYDFRPEEAHKRIRIMEAICVGTKAKWYGKPLKLMLWQKSMIECLYGVFMKDSEQLRYRECLLLIGRKNGKSELTAGLAFSDMLLRKGGETVVAANSLQDANILFEQANTMRQIRDPNRQIFNKGVGIIRCPQNGSNLLKRSLEQGNLDGLNSNLVLLDEVHVYETDDGYQALKMGEALQENALLLMITTNGFVDGGFLDKKIAFCEQIIYDGLSDAESERMLPLLYMLDDENEAFQNIRMAEKANPSMGDVKPWEYLEMQFAAAARDPAVRATVLTKDLNVKVSGGAAWLLSTDIDKCNGEIDLEQFRNCYCLGGTDLALTTDTCSSTILLRRYGDPHVYTYSHAWIPAAKLQNTPDQKSGAKYKQWIEHGYLTVVDGTYVKGGEVADWYYNLYTQYGIRPLCVGYDMAFAAEYVDKMDFYGIEQLNIRQNRTYLTNSISRIETDICNGYMLGFNPLTKWEFSNASLKVDKKGLLSVEKIHETGRIDNVDSMIDAYCAWQSKGSEYDELLKISASHD